MKKYPKIDQIKYLALLSDVTKLIESWREVIKPGSYILDINQQGIEEFRKNDDIVGDEHLTFLLSKSENETSMPFQFSLGPHTFMFRYDGMMVVEHAANYEESFDEYRMTILDLLNMSMNGQICIFLTLHYHRVCAVEVVMLKSPKAKPVVIATTANYPLIFSKATEIIKLQNRNPNIENIIPSRKLLIYRALQNGSYPFHGRTLDNLDPEPLQKSEAAKIIQKMNFNLSEADATSGKSLNRIIYSNWRSWVVIVVVGAFGIGSLKSYLAGQFTFGACS
jgi:hypothetical protein